MEKIKHFINKAPISFFILCIAFTLLIFYTLDKCGVLPQLLNGESNFIIKYLVLIGIAATFVATVGGVAIVIYIMYREIKDL